MELVTQLPLTPDETALPYAASPISDSVSPLKSRTENGSA
jgi:hypothetical protein